MKINKQNGFTLIELLVVIGIIGILAGILVPSIIVAMNKIDEHNASIQCQSIRTAIEAFKQAEGKLPCPPGDHGDAADKEYKEDASKPIIKILIGEDTTANPNSTVYLDDGTSSVDGTFKDPWDLQFTIRMDTGYNGKIDKFKTTAVVSSAGADGKWGTKDDIATHK